MNPIVRECYRLLAESNGRFPFSHLPMLLEISHSELITLQGGELSRSAWQRNP